MSIDAKSPTKTGEEQPPLLGKRDIVPTIAALIAATGLSMVSWSVLSWTSPLVLGAVFLASFVVTLTLAEWVREGDDDVLVDIVRAEREEAEAGVRLVKAPEPVSEWSSEGDHPVRQRNIHGVDIVEGAVAVVGGFAFAELLRVALRMQSWVGFSIWWALAAFVILFLLVRDRSDVEAALDRVVLVAVWAVGFLVASVLIWMIAFVVKKGLPRLQASFFTEDLSEVGPLSPGGGAKHAIIGTLEQVALATVVVVPIAVLTAVYLNEIQGRMSKPIRFIVDAMSGLPSIVAGLLVFTVVVPRYGFSGIAAAVALAVLMLPTVTRTSELILRTVPDTLREGALALGAPRWRLVQKVVLPTALAGLVTAVILGIAGAIGETAPMLLTALGSDRTVTNPNEQQSDLPLFVWKLIREPNKVQNDRAWTGALVLIMLVFFLFLTARLIAGRAQRRLRRTG